MVNPKLYEAIRKIEKGVEESLAENKKREQLIKDRRTWPLNGKAGKRDCWTLWGAAHHLACLVGHEEEEAHEDAFKIRLPQIQRCISQGELLAISSETMVIGNKAINHYDFIAKDAFQTWCMAESNYSHLYKSAKSGAAKLTEKYIHWQKRVDELYAKKNHLSHSAICIHLAGELGVASDTIRRRTKNPKNK